MRLPCAIVVLCVAVATAKRCPIKKTSSKLICYYSDFSDADACACTHVVLPENSKIETIERVRDGYRDGQIFLAVREFNENLVNTLKRVKIDGLDVNLKKINDKTDVSDFISTVKNKFGSDLSFAVSLPSKTEILAKYYDLKALAKLSDMFILQTAFLGASENVTFHPSRLSGLWDMQNTDSLVDLVTGLGAPLSKLVITSPVQAFQFTLQDPAHTTPGSPALDVKTITRDELCTKMAKEPNWTLERDQDQAGPYIFRKNIWIAFDDPTSIDIKAKYTRVRGLAGLALKDVSQDGGKRCSESSLLEAAQAGLSKQSRAPRGAVLQSLEREILDTPARPLDTIQVSPYRISRIIDVEGNIHSVRQDTRTEFECPRQGYYVHPRSCGRFYRCVKFDQLADEFSVFEFDCPAGLAFDNRYEVCVWPGSLSYSSPCTGSSEIAPVPLPRYTCPSEEGYYVDPEDCRCFFHCLDHGEPPLTAYRFCCPFGLAFDESKLMCEWPWLVPSCDAGAAIGSKYDNHVTISDARLHTYDGLGALGLVHLGGVSGPLTQSQPKEYSSVSYAGDGQFQSRNKANENYGSGHGYAYFGLDTSNAINQGLNHQEDQINNLVGHRIVPVNVIGGFSAVGSKGRSEDEVLRFDVNSIHQVAVVTPTPIPAIVAEPTLGVKSTSDFHNIGIVANVPELQYKIVAPSASNVNYQTNFEKGADAALSKAVSDLGNGSHSYVNLAPAPSPTVTSTIQLAPFVKSSTAKPFGTVSNTGYNYINQKSTYNSVQPVPIISVTPAVQTIVAPAHQQGLITYYQDYGFSGASSTTPPVVIKEALHQQPAIISSYNFQSSQNNIPVVSNSDITGNIIHSADFVQQAANRANSYKTTKPRPFEAFQPGEASSFSFQNIHNNQGYQFGEQLRPLQQLVSVTTQLPKIELQQKIQPIISVSPYSHTVKVQPTVSSVFQTPNGINTRNQHSTFVTQHQNIQPAVVSGFSIQQPAATTTSENTYTFKQPTVVSSYSFQNPAFQQAGISSYSAHQYNSNKGYVYNQSKAVLEEKPVIYSTVATPTASSFSFQSDNSEYQNVLQPVVDVTPVAPIIQRPVIHSSYKETLSSYVPVVRQPAVISSYNYRNPAPSKTKTAHAFSFTNQDFSGGYVYNKPKVVIKERPAVYSTTPTPLVTNYQSDRSERVNYQQILQPVVNVTPVVPHAQPAVVPSFSIQHPSVSNVPIVKQPAVVSSYSFQSPTVTGSKFDFANQQNLNGEYIYNKPKVTFEERPIVHSTTPTPFKYQEVVQPIVSVTPVVPIVQEYAQPAIVSRFNIQQPTASTVPVVKQPAVVSSYSFQSPTVTASKFNFGSQQQDLNSGYIYDKPKIIFEERPVIHSTTPRPFKYQEIVQPVVSVTPIGPIVQEYAQPVVVSRFNIQQPTVSTVPVVKQPAVVTSYSFQSPTLTASKFNFESQQKDLNGGYIYNKPKVVFEERPIIYSTTPRPFKYQEVVQPVVSVTPVVPIFQQHARPAVVSSFSIQQPTVSTLPVVKEPAVVSSYSFQSPTVKASKFNFGRQQLDLNGGYIYNKPKVAFDEPAIVFSTTPIPTAISSYKFGNPNKSEKLGYQEVLQPVVNVTPVVPIVQRHHQPAVISSFSIQQPTVSSLPVVKQPAVVSSYSFQSPTVTASKFNFESQQQDLNGGYIYNKPKVVFDERPAIYSTTPRQFKYQEVVQPVVSVTPVVPIAQQHAQPAVVSSFSIQQPTVSTLPIVKQPAVVSSYSFQSPTVTASKFNFGSQQQNLNGGYIYNKPNVIFEERPVVYSTTPRPQPVVSATPIVQQHAQPAVVSSFSIQQATVPTLIKEIASGYTPIVQQPAVISSYNLENSAPVKIITSQPIPIVVSSTTAAPITSRFKNIGKSEQPRYQDVLKPIASVTPTVPILKPAVVSTAPTIARQPAVVSSYSFESPIKTQITQQSDFSSFETQQQDERGGYIYKKPKIAFEETPILSVTAPPVLIDDAFPIHTVDLQFGAKLPKRPVLIEDTVVTQEEFKIKAPLPTGVDYSNRIPVIEEPFESKKAYVTGQNEEGGYEYSKPKVEFKEGPILTSNAKIIEDYYYQPTLKPNIYISTPTPFSVTSSSKSRNNFNAYYNAAKLTTTAPIVAESKVAPSLSSNIAKTTTKPKTYIKVNDFHPLLPAKLGAQCICSSNTLTLRRQPVAVPLSVGDNYIYDSQRIVEITPIPTVGIESTKNSILPAPAPAITRTRVKVRPVTTPATPFSTKIPAVTVYTEEVEPLPLQQSFLNNVDDSLEAVKTVVKVAVKEALNEHAYDRYGHGGVRSRDENLQGNVDCQRAGLFRHPGQCNKFYACRWDCTKNRFTLHVFNCPVHLTFDSTLGACNWPTQGPACAGNTLLPNE